jgi:murein L,D-transpeptidase YcbB/YkuD
VAAALLCGLIGPALATAATAAVPTPSYIGNEGLLAARAELLARQEAGGWPEVPQGPPLRPGSEDAVRVEALRARLVAGGDLAPAHLAGAYFDSALADGVRRFQRRHGLEPDGVVGRATAAALAVPIAERLRQIDFSLERRRALPPVLGEEFIWVNLPAYELELVEGGERRLAMKVVVGKRDTPSPELSAQATHYQLNPYWNVPQTIATGELAPREASSPGYLAQRRIRVFRGSGGEGEVAADSVDWNAVARGEQRIFLRQEPGPGNSLGRLALQMPNNENICLHDTPERAPFSRPARALSHGCIRLESALDLAQALLRGDPVWNAESLTAAIERGEQRDIPLPRPVPVYLVYWTAWIDAEGALQFRDDLYARDLQR